MNTVNSQQSDAPNHVSNLFHNSGADQGLGHGQPYDYEELDEYQELGRHQDNSTQRLGNALWPDWDVPRESVEDP